MGQVLSVVSIPLCPPLCLRSSIAEVPDQSLCNIKYLTEFLYTTSPLLVYHFQLRKFYSSSIAVSEELFHVLTALFIRMRDNKAKEVKVCFSDYKYILYTDASYKKWHWWYWWSLD